MKTEMGLFLIAALMLLLLGFWFIMQGTSNCEWVEYQDINGTHTTQVCQGE